MKKKALIIAGIIIAIIVVAIGVVAALKVSEKPKVEGVDLTSVDGMTAFISKIYEPLAEQIPNLMSSELDVSDIDSLTYNTGLTDNSGVEAVVVSEPMMTSQAYSLVLVKLSEDADLEKTKQNIFDNIDTRKWICVEADKKYVTDYDNTIIFLMANSDWADLVSNRINEILGEAAGETLTETVTQEIKYDQDVQFDSETADTTIE